MQNECHEKHLEDAWEDIPHPKSACAATVTEKKKPIIVPTGEEMDAADEAKKRASSPLATISEAVKRDIEETEARIRREIKDLIRHLASIESSLDEGMRPMTVDSDYLCKSAALVERAVERYNQMHFVARIVEVRS